MTDDLDFSVEALPDPSLDQAHEQIVEIMDWIDARNLHDRAKFEETYKDKADQKSYFMTKRDEVIQKNRSTLKSITMRKHWPNRNYVAKTIRSYKGDL